MSNRRTVFLVSPYGQVGGGMGSIMSNLASMPHDPSGHFDLKQLESRGGGHIALSPFYLALAVGRIVIEGLRGRLAVVHLNLAERGSVYRKAVLLAATKLAGGRVLLHLHAAQIVQFHHSIGPAGRGLLGWMFRSADQCVVLGQFWRNWVLDNFKVKPSKVSIIYNGVPPATAVMPMEPNGGGFQLLFVGNLLERKGVKELLRAFASPEVRAREIRLVIAGGGPVDSYRAMAASLGIKDKVSFTGWVSKDVARAAMVDSDALILPSYDEALPLVILEALASRIPVICTPVGSIPEVLQDQKTALFITPGDEAAIAKAIVTLVDRPDVGAALSAAGSELYNRLFTMDAFAQSIGSLYERLTPRNEDIARSVLPPVREGGR